MRVFHFLLKLGLLLWFVGSTAAFSSNSVPSQASLQQSLALIDNLLNHSSVAKKVEAVKSPEAMAYLKQARQQKSLAEQHLAKGELEASKKARDEALRLLTQAGRLANKLAGDPEKQLLLDYQARLQSVEALLSAHQRISEEKANPALQNKLLSSVKPSLERAKSLAQAKNYAGALEHVNQAYGQVTTSIESMRGGETLVRSLNFASPKEEYEYELGRYQNYQMLVKLLVEDRKAVQVSVELKRHLDEAKHYESKANQLVQRGEYAQAIPTIDKASKSLVNFIRASGVYIPG